MVSDKEKIVIGSDHGAWDLKETIKADLLSKAYQVEDYSKPTPEPVDYPQIGEKVARAVSDGSVKRGILMCGTGIGMSLVANKFPGVRAALCHDEFTARMSREHNDANVLVLGGRVLDKDLAKDIVKIWLETAFAGERHARRVAMIEEIEKANLKA
ncbi:MAG: ribose 5-phosphate isomerase B [Candidatus Schekmanbacteria bacterium]|nr:ribose 5-phosphate isomerase B [Candidatus Schekmanbacteria bacterium]